MLTQLLADKRLAVGRAAAAAAGVRPRVAERVGDRRRQAAYARRSARQLRTTDVPHFIRAYRVVGVQIRVPKWKRRRRQAPLSDFSVTTIRRSNLV